MEKYIDILLERAKMVKKWRKYLSPIVNVIKEMIPDAKIYIFGSAVRGEIVGGSDIDILIVSNEIPNSNIDRAKLKVEIERSLNLPLYHPFQFHLANKEEFKWYIIG